MDAHQGCKSPVPKIALLLLQGVLICSNGCGGRSNVPDPDPPAAAQPTQGYVGSERCGSCHGPYLPSPVHGTYFQDWMGTAHGVTSDMTPSDQAIVADFDGNGTNDFKDQLDLALLPSWSQYTTAGGAVGQFAPRLGFAGGQYTVSLDLRTFTIERVVGIGRQQQAYLARMGESRYVLPVLYDVGLKIWYPFVPENWYTWTDMNGNGFIDDDETIEGLLYPTTSHTPVILNRTGDAWERTCIGCHVTGITSLAKNAAGEFVADHAENGAGCESCHGPGNLHSSSLGGKDLPDRAIVNPSKLSAEKQRDLCMSCHTRGIGVGGVSGDQVEYPWRVDGTPFVPGQDLSEALTPQAKSNEPIHALQGGKTHMGSPGSWSHDCGDCHSAHNTTNLKLVRSTIDTPASGMKPVVFTTRNGPQGTGGLMGDASDGTFTDICEVCHTQTQYFRNDLTTPVTDHFNGERCTNCHLHSEGLLQPAGIGGADCRECHQYLFTRMDRPVPEYGHLLVCADPVYSTFPVTWRCTTCHVDHDLFEPVGRGANVRTDSLVVPTPSTGFTNSDFENSGSGGICLSCHRVFWQKSSVRSDGSYLTPPIPYTTTTPEQISAFNSAMHGGFYRVNTTFENGLTNNFLANCSKCHNDDLDPKSGVNGQTGSIKFGLHASTISRSLSPLGYSGSKNPLEEEFCYRCHSKITDPIGGTKKATPNTDWYDVWFLADRAEDIWSATGKPFGHHVGNYSGLHAVYEGLDWNWNPAGSRHVECEDCHNPHANGPPRFFNTTGTFAQPSPPTNLTVSTPNSHVWGVDVPAWPAAWNAPNPATDYTRVESSTYIWQICLKCHSAYGWGTTPPAGETDQALEFNPSNPSYHAVIGASKTTFPPNTSFVSPWTKTSLMSCADCHTNDEKNGAQGPHGSSIMGILPGPYEETTGQDGTEHHLCFKCHDFDVYGRDGSGDKDSTGFSGSDNLHTKHTEKNHYNAGRKITCFDCHAAIPHGWLRRSMLIVTSDPAPYNNGSAALSPLDVAGWPSSGNWEESSCNNSPCH